MSNKKTIIEFLKPIDVYARGTIAGLTNDEVKELGSLCEKNNLEAEDYFVVVKQGKKQAKAKDEPKAEEKGLSINELLLKGVSPEDIESQLVAGAGMSEKEAKEAVAEEVAKLEK